MNSKPDFFIKRENRLCESGRVIYELAVSGWQKAVGSSVILTTDCRCCLLTDINPLADAGGSDLSTQELEKSRRITQKIFTNLQIVAKISIAAEKHFDCNPEKNTTQKNGFR